MKPVKIGLLGGTFDPVHWGHLKVAQGALEFLNLDQLLWIPAGIPPHRETSGGATPEDRAKMVQLAIAEEPRFLLSRIELDRPDPAYTIDTVEALQVAHPEAEWFLLLGADAAQALPSWKEPQRLIDRVQIHVVPRPGTSQSDRPGRTEMLPIRTPDVSSSQVRERIQKGQSIDRLVPPGVAHYIQERGLYR